jgi:hypothetical protein
LHAFRLPGEPPGETKSIVELALGFEQRLSGLVCDDVGEVITVFADQLIPFEEALGASSWVDFAEGLEGFVGSLDGGIGIFGDVVGGCCPDFTVAWVYCWCCQ